MIDLHVHTNFCDGADSPEDIVLAAIDKGMEAVGFSGHSYTFFDENWCMSREATERYNAEIDRLKKKYAGKIRILRGLELDFYSDFVPEDYDYIIGSVHYLKLGDEFVPVDESADILVSAAKKYFGGDMISLCEEYFKTVEKVAEKTNADIIGHFDLVTKFNENQVLLDEKNERYISAYEAALQKLFKSGAAFEVNTGAFFRGYKKEAYPSVDILKLIKKHGGKLILSSDSHKKETLCGRFSEYEKILKELGFENNDFIKF